MRRREFIPLLGGAAAWPLAARAQQPALPVIGFLGFGSLGWFAPQVVGFRQGLNQTGYVEGQNVVVEFRWAESRVDRFPALAADLVRHQVAVIVAHSPGGVRAARAASATVPIVFVMGEDPIKEGLIASLSRPGGNVTGFTNFANQLAGKQLGLLREIVPNPSAFAILVNPNNPNAEPDTTDAKAAADALGRELRVFGASTERDLETAFDTMAQLRVGALLVNIDPFFIGQSKQIVALAASHAVPTIYDRRDFPVAGGLMSYGASEVDAFRQCGIYVGRILKGAKPADLPAQQSTKFEFVINLQTVKTLGLTVPPGLLAIADEVIE
jgi:ABC-type uncharacterized transport system substrate-binding protein